MTKRLQIIYNHISSGEVFADVGCDHGYVAKAVLDSGKFKKVIISDISKPSLDKAVDLLKPFGDRVISVVSDGFKSYPIVPNEAVIAGMGGEEIVKILSDSFLVSRLILSPQKNTDKVRRFLVENSYKIIKDFTFYADKKFYDLIVSEKGEDFYTEDEYVFGRDNLLKKPSDFILKIQKDINLYQNIVDSEDSSTSTKNAIKLKISKLKEVIK